MNAELFKAEMKQAVKKAIAHLDRGTVGIGNDCLWQITAKYISQCPNAPTGTNCAWVARQTFDEVISQKPFAGFVYQQ